MLVGEVHAEVEQHRYSHVNAYRLERIIDGILLLTYKIRQHHSRCVACKSSPCTRHIAISRHEQHVDGDEHGASCAREPGSPDGLVDKLVPEREVEVHAHHYLGSHHNGHNAQSRPVVAADDMLQYVEIAYHYEERQQSEYDEELHRLGVRFAVVLVLRLAEHERFVGIAERLGYHSHNHGYLRCGAIYAQLGVSVAAFVDVGEENLVGSLVENACDAQHQYRP